MIFSCYAHDRTPLQAAQFFAEVYFPHPRDVDKIEQFGECWVFMLRDGASLYRLEYCPGVPHCDPASYIVSRLTGPLQSHPEP